MEIVLSVIILALVVGGMSIGVLMGRKPIQGSCGGLNNMGLKGECEICGGNPDNCENQRDTNKTNPELAVNVGKNN